MDGTIENIKEVEREEQSVGRMTTRNMCAKHVPVAMVAEMAGSQKLTGSDAVNTIRGFAESNRCRDRVAQGEWHRGVVPKFAEEKLLHPKRLYKTKRHADSSLERYKARLVACGNEQSHGDDIQYRNEHDDGEDSSAARKVVASPRATRRHF